MDPKKDPRIAFILRVSRLQPLLLGMLLYGFVAKMQHWPAAGIVLTIGACALTWLFLLKGNFYIDLSWKPSDRLFHQALFILLSVGVLALMFHLQSWPGWEFLALASMMGFMLVFFLLVQKRLSIMKFLNMIELSSFVLIMIYFMRVFLIQDI